MKVRTFVAEGEREHEGGTPPPPTSASVKVHTFVAEGEREHEGVHAVAACEREYEACTSSPPTSASKQACAWSPPASTPSASDPAARRGEKALAQRPPARDPVRVDVLHWVVFGVLPAVAAVLLGVGAAGPKLLALSLAIALCVPFGMAAGWPDWPWRLSVHDGDPFAWLWWAFAFAGLVGVGYDARLLPRPLLLALDVALVLSLPWLLSGPLRAGFTFEQCVLWLSAGWAILGCTWWVLRGAAKLQPGIAVPLAGTIALVADALVLRARGAQLDWELAGVGAVALGMAVATTIWRRPFVCGAGSTLAITVAHVGLLYCGRSEGELLRQPFLLALIAPLPMGLVLTKAFAEGRATGAVLGVLGTAALAGAAIAAA